MADRLTITALLVDVELEVTLSIFVSVCPEVVGRVHEGVPTMHCESQDLRVTHCESQGMHRESQGRRSEDVGEVNWWQFATSLSSRRMAVVAGVMHCESQARTQIFSDLVDFVTQTTKRLNASREFMR